MTKHEYICAICEIISQKSHCSKRKVGAIFINNEYEILTTGYNSTPKGFPACVTYHLINDQCTETIHAEQNAILQAAKRGQALNNSILYCTYLPCKQCSRFLINLNIKKIYFKEYNNDGGDKILNDANIPIEQWEKNSLQNENFMI